MNWGINNIIKFVIKFRFDEGDCIDQNVIKNY